MTTLPGVSISDAEKAGVRAAIFTHLAGLVVAPTVGALWERGVLELLAGAAGALRVLGHRRADARQSPGTCAWRFGCSRRAAG